MTPQATVEVRYAMRNTLMPSPERPVVRGVIAVAAVLIAFVLREVLSWAAGPDFSEFVVFYPSIMIVTLLAGLWPGLLSVFLTAGVLAVLSVIPERVLPFSPRTTNLVSLAFFVGVSGFLVTVAELYRQSRQKAAAYDKEQALRVSQAALRQQAELLRLSFDAIIVWRMGGGIESWNRGAEELYGFTESEALGRGIHELLRTSHALPWPAFEQELREHGQWDGELVHVTREGRSVVVSSRLHLGHDSDRGTSVLEIDRDITEQKRVQAELQSAHDELEEKIQQRTAELLKANRMLLMVSACDQALVQMSDERELIAVICQIIQDEGGYPLVWVGLRDEAGEAQLRCVASAGDRGGFLDELRRREGEAALEAGPAGEALRSGAPSIRDDISAETAAGHWWNLALARGFRGAAALPLPGVAAPFGVLVIYSDRTPPFEKSQLSLLTELVNDLAFGVMALRARGERDQAQRALETQAAQLRMLAGEVVRTEQRERRRIALLLHDQLQQLLAAALYGLSDLRAEATAAVRRETVARLDGLIRDCIAMSRSLTSELGHPALAEPDIGAGLDWLAAWMREKHGLSVTVRSPAPVVLPAEEVRVTLLQAVRELLFNVVKHAGVRTAMVTVDASEEGRVRVSVTDDGTGFDTTRAGWDAAGVSGGIGLFSIRERVALTGGGVDVESAPGHGTRVTVWVPAVPAERAETAAAAAVPDSPAAEGTAHEGARDGRIRVLLVDDHAVVRAGLALQLRQQPDIEVVGEAADGASALQLVGTLRPDVVTMDISMPGMGGVEAARRIRASFPDTAVVGLSMFDDEHRAAAMREAGAVTHISKGASLESLLEAIRTGATTVNRGRGIPVRRAVS
jgi:PAS domain S-box-containing protein